MIAPGPDEATLEAARAHTLQITGNIPGGRRDSGLYPSLHLDRAVGEDASFQNKVHLAMDAKGFGPAADDDSD